MFALLYEWFGPLLRQWELYDLNVLRYVSFRAGMAALTALAVVLVVAPVVIRRLIALKIGDRPEFHNATLNAITANKANVPTMGGVLIVGAIVGATLLWADPRNPFVTLGLVVVVWLAGLGLADDRLKLLARAANAASRDGLRMSEKLLFQFGLAGIVAWFLLSVPDFAPRAPELWLPLIKTPVIIGVAGFVVLAALMITGFSNAVNLTDGMDGLAPGCVTLAATAMAILCYLAGEVFWFGLSADRVTAHYWADYLNMPRVPGAEELTVFAGAMAGACAGFLWYNTHPATVFMGDTGSLPLGGSLAYLAVATRNEWLLMLIGGVFVAEAASVIIQVAYFQATGGRRVFRMAPIHHHFQLGATDAQRLPEQKVVVRFWLAAAILAVLGLAAIKLR